MSKTTLYVIAKSAEDEAGDQSKVTVSLGASSSSSMLISSVGIINVAGVKFQFPNGSRLSFSQPINNQLIMITESIL